MRKPIIRAMTDGRFVRMWPAGFGARFPTGPYDSFEEAFCQQDFFTSARECGYTIEPLGEKRQ